MKFRLFLEDLIKRGMSYFVFIVRKASLFSCDSLGTLLNVPFFAHGYSSHFLLALFDDVSL